MATVRRPAALVALALVTAACGGGTSASPIPVPSGAVVLKAVDLKFAPAHLSVEAGQPFVLYFDNEDSAQHNVVVVAGDGTRVLVGDILPASTQRIYNVPTLTAGTYKLICDIHSDMSGSLEVLPPPE